MNTFMRDSDAFAWYMERDPTLRATIVGVAWLEQSPDWDTLVAKIDRATRRIPMFRQCVVEPPGRLATPRWTVDDRVRSHLARPADRLAGTAHCRPPSSSSRAMPR